MFILRADWSKQGPDRDEEEIAALTSAHARYYAYLDDNRARFPSGVYELAASKWRHNFSDHRALHDSWIEAFRFLDGSLPKSGGDRINDLEILVLGAYHDGRVRLRYKNVHEVRLSLSNARAGPWEIYRDEIRLSETGLVVHEIEFLGCENWLIECEDMEQHWEQLAAPKLG